MEYTRFEANTSLTQKLSHFVNPKFNYRAHKSPPLVPVLRHMNYVHYLSRLYVRSN
jgi:hypothetical protein